MYLLSLKLSQYNELQYCATGQYSHPFSHRTIAAFSDTLKDLVTKFKPMLGYTSLGHCYLVFTEKPNNLDAVSSYSSVRFNHYLEMHSRFWNAYDPNVSLSAFNHNVYFVAELLEMPNPHEVITNLIEKAQNEHDELLKVSKTEMKGYEHFRYGVVSKLVLKEVITPIPQHNGMTHLDVKHSEVGVLLKMCKEEVLSKLNYLLTEKLIPPELNKGTQYCDLVN